MDESTKHSIVDKYLSYKKYKEELKKYLNRRILEQRKYFPDIKDIDTIKAEDFDENLHTELYGLLMKLKDKELEEDLKKCVEKMLEIMPKKKDEDIDEFERLMERYF